MKKRTKILFPTDFSDPAFNAFRYALLLVDAMDADLQLIHTVYPEAEPLDLPVMVAKSSQIRVDAARESMKAFVELALAQVGSQLKNVPPIISDIDVGTPIQSIVNRAKREQVDLIVMGTRGERKGIEKLLGGIASGVVVHADCPVMVVPEEVPFKQPAKIAYATGVSDSDPFEIWKATQLLEPFAPNFHCVHFNMTGKMSDDHEKMEQMKAFFEGRSPATPIQFYHLPGKKLQDDLNHFIEEHQMDMLIMSQPKRSFLEGLFHRSQTRRMAVSCDVPLLILKEN
ncbi:MAG: universal stress protein [Bacteroidota bacterium]